MSEMHFQEPSRKFAERRSEGSLPAEADVPHRPTRGAAPEPWSCAVHKLGSLHSLFSGAPPQALHPKPPPHIVQDAFPLQLPGSIDVAEKQAC